MAPVLIALLLLPALSEAKLLPKAPCVSQCKASLPAACLKPNGKVKGQCHFKRLVRQCRKSQPVCTTSTTTTSTSTTTTTSSTSTTTSTTTTTTAGPECPATGCTHILDFTNGLAGGACGEIDSATGKIRDLTCGGLNIGGGGSIVGEGPTPDGSISRFLLTCGTPTGGVCTVGPFAVAPAPQSLEPDCSATGCNFGTPLPIPNPVFRNLSTCVRNTFHADTSGTINLDDGTSSQAVSLDSDIYITGNADQPCPRCVAGHCDRGLGTACVSANSIGLTRDCPTGGVAPGKPCQPGVPNGDGCADGTHVGVIGVDLTPLATHAVTRTATDGLFCPDQKTAGCFGQPTCTTITAQGSSAPVLASVFCIAATPNGLVNASADLAGPGAVTLPGTFLVQ